MNREKQVEILGSRIANMRAASEAAMQEIISYVVAGEISAYKAWRLSGIAQGTFYRAVNKAIKEGQK
jgi:hypothetical protein